MTYNSGWDNLVVRVYEISGCSTLSLKYPFIPWYLVLVAARRETNLVELPIKLCQKCVPDTSKLSRSIWSFGIHGKTLCDVVNMQVLTNELWITIICFDVVILQSEIHHAI